MTDPTPTCATCRWYDSSPGDTDGACRRLPPSTHGWAMVGYGDWCGEWQIRGPRIDKETGLAADRVLDVAAGRTVSLEDLEHEHP